MESFTIELFGDTETYSEVPINHGTHAYAEAAEVMIFTYAIGDGEVKCWDRTANKEMPSELRNTLMNPRTKIIMHNGGMFDRTVIRHSLGIDLSIRRIHDTMVQAMAHGLPGSLGTLCDILGIASDAAKDKAGKGLINLFCKPRPSNNILQRATRETNPVEWEQFINYAKKDIEAMRAIYRKLPTWNYQGGELALWHRDQNINDRGFPVDREFAEGAIRAVKKQQKVLADRTSDLTYGFVNSAQQRNALLQHILDAYGVTLPDLTASTLERRVNDPDLPVELRELLAIRLQASTTSTSKYQKLIDATSKDGRLRGTLQFCGASRTGRWSGRTFQPQNLPRPAHKQADIDLCIRAVKADCADLIFGDDLMKVISSSIRGCIVASPGKKIVVSDLSNIEGRVAAWLAGEAWKLEAFRAFDLGVGDDLYKITAAKSFNITPDEVSKDERQIGKVQELALGYQGGVGAFLTFSSAYKLDLTALADRIYHQLFDEDEKLLRRVETAWEWAVKKNRTYGLAEKVYHVCEALKILWRWAHPEISSYWWDLENTVRSAINTPGTTFPCRKLKVRRDGAWLRIGLPSGRSLCYAAPKAMDEPEVCEECAGKGFIQDVRLESYITGNTCTGCKGKGTIMVKSITYMGLNQYSRKWCRTKTYGGKLFENVCQAVARDVMAANMPHIEDAGYSIILSVHDELLTEAKDVEEFNDKELSNLLSTNPVWGEGLPLAAGGFEAHRYKKD